MASSISPSKTEPWQRFTVLDALLLQAGYALALALILSPYRRLAVTTFDEGALFVLLAAFCLGSALSGPIILGSHWLTRGRRRGLSAGEWLWLSPIALLLVGTFGIWALHWTAQLMPNPDETRAVFFGLLGLVLFLAEIGCMLNALIVVLARSDGGLKEPPCWWTDRFGTLTCLLTATIVVLSVFAVLSVPAALG